MQEKHCWPLTAVTDKQLQPTLALDHLFTELLEHLASLTSNVSAGGRVWLGSVLVASDGPVVVAHDSASGTARGRLYGAPATKKSYTASFFDMVRVEDGRIVHRVQQADALGQMRQLYGRRVLGSFGISALLWRL